MYLVSVATFMKVSFIVILVVSVDTFMNVSFIVILVTMSLCHTCRKKLCLPLSVELVETGAGELGCVLSLLAGRGTVADRLHLVNVRVFLD